MRSVIYPGQREGTYRTTNFLTHLFYQGNYLPCGIIPQYLQRSLFTRGGGWGEGVLLLNFGSIYCIRVTIYPAAYPIILEEVTIYPSKFTVLFWLVSEPLFALVFSFCYDIANTIREYLGKFSDSSQ